MIKKVLKPTSNVFGKRLREARIAAGVTQEAVGVAIGLDEGPAGIRISRYESGVHMPNLDVIWDLAAALDIPAAYLVTEDDQMAKRILDIYKLNRAGRKELDGLLASLDAHRS